MDPYNDFSLNNPIPPNQVADILLQNFQSHYNGNKAPFGLYIHPVWLGKGDGTAIPDGTAKLAAMNKFLDSAMGNPNVWMVTNQQVLEYSKNPVPASELANQWYMKCFYKPTQ